MLLQQMSDVRARGYAKRDLRGEPDKRWRVHAWRWRVLCIETRAKKREGKKVQWRE